MNEISSAPPRQAAQKTPRQTAEEMRALLAEPHTQAYLRAYALSLTRNLVDAQDLVQTTCLRALIALHNLEVNGTGYVDEGNPKSWLMRIVRNERISHARKRSTKVEINESALPPRPEPGCMARQLPSVEINEAKKFIATLPETQANVLTLVGKDHTYQEMADSENVSIGTIRSRLFRARASMHRIFDDKLTP